MLPKITLPRLGDLDVENGGKNAGKYLDHIKITDLAKLDKTQWNTFCLALITGYLNSVYIDDEIPF